jgi:hypothetical protein
LIPSFEVTNSETAGIEQKDGQIAHLDRNPSNNHLENLVWLCLPHHDDYDSIRWQTKRLTADEVKFYRSILYEQLAKPPYSAPKEDDPIVDDYYDESDLALNVILRYTSADNATNKVITSQILTRIEQLYQFYRLQRIEYDKVEDLHSEETNLDAYYWEIHFQLLEQFSLSNKIYGLWPEETPNSRWLKSARRLTKKWVAGQLSYNQCLDLIWVFDTEFDLDPFYLLFGIPTNDMSRIQKRALRAFIFEHGQRIADVPF